MVHGQQFGGRAGCCGIGMCSGGCFLFSSQLYVCGLLPAACTRTPVFSCFEASRCATPCPGGHLCGWGLWLFPSLPSVSVAKYCFCPGPTTRDSHLYIQAAPAIRRGRFCFGQFGHWPCWDHSFCSGEARASSPLPLTAWHSCLERNGWPAVASTRPRPWPRPPAVHASVGFRGLSGGVRRGRPGAWRGGQQPRARGVCCVAASTTAASATWPRPHPPPPP